ncbi:MAG TPA: c-type cytochrome [Bryobacteraceae bacterium]|nr:c-type cytochrome [Bryobacteraceae bacterium]
MATATAGMTLLAAQNPPQTNPAASQAQTPPDRGGNTQVPPAGAPAGPGQGTPGTVIGGRRAATRERPSAYPTHEVDSEKAARGKVTFGVTCSFCHGSDARGGEGGPNLIRSQLVLNDKDGETIAPVIQNGRVDRGMPKFDLTMAQISDIAAFLHSFKVGGYDISRQKPPSILVGDATQGKATFQTICGSCHSVTGDLKAFASRFDDPRTMQQAWIMPGAGGRGMMGQEGSSTHVAPTTVSVTMPSGETIEGKLSRIDDFNVTLIDSDGYERTFARNGDEPKVTIHDPLEPHRQLLAKYTDKEIHDITAYLETIK